MQPEQTNGTGPREAQLAELPVPVLLRRLSDQATLLMREEVALAKAELSEKGRRAGIGAGMFGAAALLALFALGALTTAAIVAFDLLVATWLAALIVAAIWLVLAAIAALVGRAQVRRAGSPVPEQTVETLKEDVRWTKERAQAARSR